MADVTNIDDARKDKIRSALRESLASTSNGLPLPTLSNVIKVLRVDPDLEGYYTYDRFLGRLQTTRRSIAEDSPVDTQVPGFSSYDLELQTYLQDNGFDKIARSTVTDALEYYSHMIGTDSLVDYLEGLEWDGVARVDTWLTTYAGVDDTDIAALYGSCFLVGMVARGLDPGCQLDNTLVLMGGQGVGKSELCRILGGEWVLEDLPSIHNGDKAASEVLQGKWLVEVAEMKATQRASDEAVKSFLSRKDDTYRAAYARTSVTHPRRCAFVSTTNRGDFLTDLTGARRFWPVEVKRAVDLEGLRRDRDQLFAEAVKLYKDGEQWWLNPEESAMAVDHVEQFTHEVLWHGVFMTACEQAAKDNGHARLADVFESRGELLRQHMTRRGADQLNPRNAAALLRARGWTKVHTRTGKVWAPPCDHKGD